MKHPKRLTLPDFILSESDIELALELPVKRKMELLFRILPDINEPDSVKRVVASGLIMFGDMYGRSFSKTKLIQYLLYNYFMGNFPVSPGGDSYKNFTQIEPSVEDDFDFW